ncbi:hypothetical protein E1297_31520 [Roseibium sp. RKSG952]|nr:hypothetical protein [Roseibium sp. RKSG952]
MGTVSTDQSAAAVDTDSPILTHREGNSLSPVLDQMRKLVATAIVSVTPCKTCVLENSENTLEAKVRINPAIIEITASKFATRRGNRFIPKRAKQAINAGSMGVNHADKYMTNTKSGS